VSPAASIPTPTATHAHTFIPVNGSAPPWAEAEAALVPLELELPPAAVAVGCEAEEPLLEAVEPLELDPELDPDDDEPLECEVVLLPVRGSTYCWSPAEVLVPDASTAAAPASDPATSPTRHARMRTARRTGRIQPGAIRTRASAPGMDDVPGAQAGAPDREDVAAGYRQQ